MARADCRIFIAPLAVTCVMSVAGFTPVGAQEVGDAARGEQLYYDHGCYGCHGFNGETGAHDLVATDSPRIADVERFTAYLRLRADRAPVLPSTGMPSYPESSLSDADAVDIYAHVRTFELSAPDVDDIPAFRAILESARRPYVRRGDEVPLRPGPGPRGS